MTPAQTAVPVILLVALTVGIVLWTRIDGAFRRSHARLIAMLREQPTKTRRILRPAGFIEIPIDHRAWSTGIVQPAPDSYRDDTGTQRNEAEA